MSACFTYELVRVFPPASSHAALLRVNLDGIDVEVTALFWPAGRSADRAQDEIEFWSKHVSPQLLTRIASALNEQQVMAQIRTAVDQLCAKEEASK